MLPLGLVDALAAHRRPAEVADRHTVGIWGDMRPPEAQASPQGRLMCPTTSRGHPMATVPDMGQGGSTQVHDVAALLIERQHARRRAIDKLQLQKLLYLVQQAHITRTGVPLVGARFLAYKHGPVVREVEDTYRTVVDDRDPLPGPVGGRPERVPEDGAATVDEVLSHFGGWSGRTLEKFVKWDGSPWNIARGDLPPSERSAKPISNDDITDWALTHPVAPADAWRAAHPRPNSEDADIFTAFARVDLESLGEDKRLRWKRPPDGPLLTLEDPAH